jgi:apolipoprotein N-acyltransferase
MWKKLNKKLGKQGTSLFPYLIAGAGGILMGVTVAPFGWWFFAWFALAPLWVLVVKCQQNKQNPLSLAIIWAIAYHGMAIAWITGIYPMDWLGVPWFAGLAITFFCWSFISLWGGILVSVWALIMVRLDRQKSGLYILSGTALWCVLESLWSLGPLWWSSLSYTQSPENLVILHLGQLSGPTTITAVIVAVNGLIAEAWLNYQPKRLVNLYLAYAVVILFTSHVIGYILYLYPLNEVTTARLNIGIVQGNIPNQIKLGEEGLRRAMIGYTQGYITLANQGVAAVLTPEGALPIFSRELNQTPLVREVKAQGVVAWIGAFGEKGNISYTNSLFTVVGDGTIFSHYDKSKLVPLGEYIPFAEIFGGIVQRLSPLEASQVPGLENQIFTTPFGQAIASICYESAFAENFRRQAIAGGEFILSAANDAHYSAAMPAQHHAQDIMRAIETDRWAVRATNTGYSAFVNPHGITLWKSRHNQYEVHQETIYRRQTRTLYVSWGNWLMPLFIIFAVGFPVIEKITRREE